MNIGAHEALERLKEGNARFVADRSRESLADFHRRAELVDGQQPFAVVLGCSDSRVPAEIVFDQGLGDLFVIRVAGNIVAPSQIGSVEFAVEQLGVQLVVVLGHTQCGAILATIVALQRPDGDASANLNSIVSRILPAVESVVDASSNLDSDALAEAAVRANVRRSLGELRDGSEILARRIADGSLVLVGAEYSLASGIVTFL